MNDDDVTDVCGDVSTKLDWRSVSVRRTSGLVRRKSSTLMPRARDGSTKKRTGMRRAFSVSQSKEFAKPRLVRIVSGSELRSRRMSSTLKRQQQNQD